MASLHSPPLYTRRRTLRRSTLPFTTVEDDPDIAPVLKVAAQLFVPIQACAGHDKDEHV